MLTECPAPVLLPVINNSKVRGYVLNNQKVREPDAWCRHGESRCIIYSTSLFTQKHNNPHRFGAVGGWVGERQRSVSAEGSAVFRKRGEFNCAEKINPKAAEYKGPAGPRRAPRGGNSIIGLREHRDLVCLAINPGVSLIHRRHSLSEEEH